MIKYKNRTKKDENMCQIFHKSCTKRSVIRRDVQAEEAVSIKLS